MAPYASLRSGSSIDGSVFIGGDFDQRGEVHLPLFGETSQDSPVPGTGDHRANLNQSYGDSYMETAISLVKSFDDVKAVERSCIAVDEDPLRAFLNAVESHRTLLEGRVHGKSLARG